MEWAEFHPRRDESAVSFSGLPDMSPRDISAALNDTASSAGEDFYHLFAKGIAPHPGEPTRTLDDILRAYVRDTRKWKAAAKSPGAEDPLRLHDPQQVSF